MGGGEGEYVCDGVVLLVNRDAVLKQVAPPPKNVSANNYNTLQMCKTMAPPPILLCCVSSAGVFN